MLHVIHINRYPSFNVNIEGTSHGILHNDPEQKHSLSDPSKIAGMVAFGSETLFTTHHYSFKSKVPTDHL